MIAARFVVNGEEREMREVEESWLARAEANHENVLLTDGNTYQVSAVEYISDGGRKSARVTLVAPRFARAS